MSWLGLLLVGIGLCDLIFSIRPARVVPECAAAIVTVLLGLACGLTGVRDVLALLVIAAVVVAWGQAVTYGFREHRHGVPLVVLVVGLGLALLFAGAASTGDGAVQDWLDSSPLGFVHGLSQDRAVVLFGALLVQLSTGNVIVRLVLGVTGTLKPAPARQAPTHGDAEPPLKGGRLLGPMERLFIVGMALAGQLTAASIIVAAKGLLRYPELQASRDPIDRETGLPGPGIHAVTEYFLLGTLLSWLVAFGTLVLLV